MHIKHNKGGRQVRQLPSYVVTKEKVVLSGNICNFFWFLAHEAGYYTAEIAPIDVKAKKGKVAMAQDEHPRPQTTLEQMAKLAPVFKKGGTVTAANASVSLHLWPLTWPGYFHV